MLSLEYGQDCKSQCEQKSELLLNPSVSPLQKDGELHEWKKQIEKDVATLKAESNRGVIKKVLHDSNVGCDQLAALEVKDQILSPDQAQKVVAWAASHYLMAAEEPAVKKGRLQLTVDRCVPGADRKVSFGLHAAEGLASISVCTERGRKSG